MRDRSGELAQPAAAAFTRIPPAAARRRAGLAVAELVLVTVSAAGLGVRCPIRAAFGIDCPGCGGTRALAALLRGDVPQAARENAAALVAGAAAAGYIIAPAHVGRAARVMQAAAERRRLTRWWARHPQTTVCLGAGLWCVARNFARMRRAPRRPVS